MHLVDLTLPAPTENLALDEELLDRPNPHEYFRLWESPTPLVVLGRSSKLEVEVNQLACFELDVPIVRRVSGGAAVVAGPGCLMYAVVLDLERRPEMAMVDRAHAWVLGQFVEALRPLVQNVTCAGTSDLALLPEGSNSPLPRKFSGNSIRKKRTRLLYHGTLLYDFDLSRIDRLLRMPPRHPDYRVGRAHADFVTNLPLDSTTLRETLITHWKRV